MCSSLLFIRYAAKRRVRERASAGHKEMADQVVGELVGSSSTVLVRGEAACRSLHAWQGGAFGDLLICDAVSGHAITGQPPGPKGARRPPGSYVVMLRLRAWEAIYLGFETCPPRLKVVDVPAAGDADVHALTFSQVEEAAAAIAAQAPALELEPCWMALTQAEPQLPQLYAAYHALRHAGWFIRDGFKFGFDFALYDSTGPPARHAPLGALVLTREDEGERSWLWLQRHARVCHSVGKGLLLCRVDEPNDEAASGADQGSRAIPPRLGVRTMRVDGWNAGREHAILSN